MLRPVCRAGLHAASAAGSALGSGFAQLGGSIWELVWDRTCKPILQACGSGLAAAWQEHVLPQVLAVSGQTKAAFSFVGQALLLPLLQLVGNAAAAALNGLVWVLVQTVGLAYFHVVQPIAMWLYHVAIAPFAGMLALLAGAFSMFAFVLNSLGFQIRPRASPSLRSLPNIVTEPSDTELSQPA